MICVNCRLPHLSALCQCQFDVVLLLFRLIGNQQKANALKINGFNVTGHYGRHLWIRLALLERTLAKIIGTCLDYHG